MTVGFQLEQRCMVLRERDDSQNSHSRSTSPGSSSSSNLAEADFTNKDQWVGSLSELPDYDYPAPIFVRNTFLDTPIVRPVSLDEFIQERRIQSCPIEQVVFPDDEAQEAVYAQRSNFRRAATMGATLLTEVSNDAAVVAARAVSSFSSWLNPVDSVALTTASSIPELQNDQHDCYGMPGQGPSQVICLASALQQPELGSSELPTVGSAGHRWGACKPCAFLHRRGCENGVDCAFCHLCDSGEKKRRQKEKIATLREMRRVS
jgi:hypothetical protein